MILRCYYQIMVLLVTITVLMQMMIGSTPPFFVLALCQVQCLDGKVINFIPYPEPQRAPAYLDLIQA